MSEETQKTKSISASYLPRCVTKDLSKYRNIALLSIFVLVMILTCLFYYKANKDIRKITISNMELEIPRSYLTGSPDSKNDGYHKELDLAFNYSETKRSIGNSKALQLAFTYSEIKGGIGNGKDYVSLSFKDMSEYFNRDKVTKPQHLYNEYWDEYVEIDKEEDVYKIKYKDFNQDLKREHYRIESYGKEHDIEKVIKSMKENPGLSAEKEIMFRRIMTKQNEKFKKRLNGELKPYFKHIYTNDDPENPNEFIVCESRLYSKNAYCDSAFFYDDLFIEIHFSRKSLNEFNDIKEQTLQLIKKWKQ